MYRHGIFIQEISTNIQPMLSLAAPSVVIGVAPCQNASVANSAQICFSLNDFKEKYGWSTDFNTYTLCEAAFCFFSLFRIAPVIFVNVLDPTTHKKAATKTITLARYRAELSAQIVLSTLVVKSGDATLAKNTDYTAEYKDATLVIAVKNKNKVSNNTLQLSYDELNPAQITTADIIAGIEAGVEDVYPKFQMNAGIILAPKWSCDPEVAAVMAAACLDINSCFKAVTYVDIPTDTVTTYDACNEYKNNNNLVDENMYLCWPKVALGGKQYHLSTQAAALSCRLDAENGDVPYISPSNKNLQCNAAVLANGTEVLLGKGKADYLNSIGIATALNFAGGWRLWGNRTAAYPVVADVKDNFLTNRRMFCWIGNTLITSFFWRIDAPINRRLVQSILNSVNIWLNGLSAREMLLGGRVEFLEEENSVSELINGHIVFHLFIAPPSPAEHVDFLLELDVNYFNTLFS